TVPGSTATNPFTTNVLVRIPDASIMPITTRSQSRSASLWAIAQLRWGWTGALDYAWSENRYEFLAHGVDATARIADLASGALNPFVDTLRYPLDLQKYLYSHPYQRANRLHTVTL